MTTQTSRPFRIAKAGENTNLRRSQRLRKPDVLPVHADCSTSGQKHRVASSDDNQSSSRKRRRSTPPGVNEPATQKRRSQQKLHTSSSSQKDELDAATTAKLLRDEEDILKRIELLERREQKARISTRVCEATSARQTLQFLEDNFSCSLCYEVIADPYCLNSSTCGHTFCALCCLKCFFSKLHTVCGYWHDPVDCPMCRSPLPEPSDSFPRDRASFPFIPNRDLNKLICSMVDKLTAYTSDIKLETPVPDDLNELEALIQPWTSGGQTLEDWRKRGASGRAEMSYLISNWSKLDAPDFVRMKNRLGV